MTKLKIFLLKLLSFGIIKTVSTVPIEIIFVKRIIQGQKLAKISIKTSNLTAIRFYM